MKIKWQIRSLALILFFGALALMLSVPAAAAPTAPTFTVNSITDAPAGGDLTNGVCETLTGNGICTLRAAIMKANHFPGGGVTINVPANALPYQLTILPAGADDETTGDLNITAPVTIAGAGAASTIIDGNATDSVFLINISGVATITGVTIRNGFALGGGGIYITSGTLTLNNSTISGNSAGQYGGGIYSNQTVTLNNSTVSGNRAKSGGGIFNGGTLTLNNSTVSGNLASNSVGGGIVVSGSAIATLNNSTVSANGAHGSGGGIYQGGNLKLFHVTVAGNIADIDSASAGTGGGIYRVAGSPTNELWNSILAENFSNSSTNNCDGLQ